MYLFVGHRQGETALYIYIYMVFDKPNTTPLSDWYLEYAVYLMNDLSCSLSPPSSHLSFSIVSSKRA